VRPDCEEFAASTNEPHVFLAHTPKPHVAIGKGGDANAFTKIRPIV
jgi:hypothetical protein